MKEEYLGRLCNIISGSPNPQSDKAFSESDGLNFVRMKDLGKVHLTTNLVDTEFKLDREYGRENGYKVVKKGSILLPRSGSVGLNHRAILGVDSYIVSHIFALEIIDENIINNYFLYYYLQNLDLGRIANKTTGLDSLTKERLGLIKVPLPPIKEQIRIISILNEIQGIIENRKKNIGLLKDLLRSCFMSLFGDPVTNPLELKTIKLSSKKFSITSGTTPSRKIDEYYGDEIPWVKSTDINNDIILETEEAITRKAIDETIARIYPKGSVLLAMYGQGKTRGKVAMLGIEASTNQACAVINSNDISNIYIYSFLKYSYDFLRSISKGGNRDNLSLSELKKINLSIPSQEAQNKYEKIFNIIQLSIDNQEKSLYILELLFSSILQNSFIQKVSNIDEEPIFKELIKKFTAQDLRGNKQRLQYLINLFEQQNFDEFKDFTETRKILFELMEEEEIIQTFGNDNKVKLQVK